MRPHYIRHLLSILVAFAAAAILAVAMARPAAAGDVTPDRLINANKEPQNWLTHHGDYRAHRYSSLKRINAKNVANLKAAFTYALGGIEVGGFWEYGGLEGTPLAEDGYLYVTTGWGQLYKLDVRGNKALLEWVYTAKYDKDWAGNVTCCGVDNRGAALSGDLVIHATLDGKVHALKKSDGSVAWETQLADNAKAETMTMAPLALKDMVIVGVSGGEFGVRGWLAAIDAKTGKERWRTYTVPSPGEPGHETWKDDHDAWKTGGGTTWVTGSYDVEQDTLFWGTGNPGPDWDNAYRPGENLYTDSMLALDPNTGKIKWHFQFTPNDPYDYDAVNELVLVDTTHKGQKVKVGIQANRNGFLYALDRTNGKFLWGTPYVNKVNWTRGLDESTGKPLDYDPQKLVQSYVPGTAPTRDGGDALNCPNLMGGKNWYPTSYNPDLNLLYIPINESCGGLKTATTNHGDYKARELYAGGGFTQPTKFSGSLAAVDVASGKVVAKKDYDFPVLSGTLTTAGGLVFFAHGTGAIVAVDAKTLEELWRFETGSGVNAPPITYEVNGKQYVAILVGKGGGIPKWFTTAAPHYVNINPSAMLFVFTL